MKQQITVYVYARRNLDDKPQFNVFSSDLGDSDSYFGRRMHSCQIEVEAPTDAELVAIELATLREQEQRALDEFRKTQRAIHDRIAKLTALTHEVPA